MSQVAANAAQQLRGLQVGDAIEVIWIDAFWEGESYWISRAEHAVPDKEFDTIRTVGIYLSHDKRFLRLAQSISEEIGSGYHVPVAVIESVRVLK